jgi:hypothetical protein
VLKTFAKRLFVRRSIALVAAYAIALSSVFASVGAARAEGKTATQPGGIICHTDATGRIAPSSDDTNNKICADCCCVGCITFMAGIPPPTSKPVAEPQSSSQRVAPPVIAVQVGGPPAKSHRSRAPPGSA